MRLRLVTLAEFTRVGVSNENVDHHLQRIVVVELKETSPLQGSRFSAKLFLKLAAGTLLKRLANVNLSTRPVVVALAEATFLADKKDAITLDHVNGM